MPTSIEIQWWLQPHGPDSAYPFYPAQSDLHYVLPEFGVRMPFKPTDFTQVNHQINRVLVTRALRLLDVQPQERVADLFCGLGNFTLPLATQAREVVGIEGSQALIERANANAVVNGLAGKTEFHCRNLFEVTTADWIALGKFDRCWSIRRAMAPSRLCEALAGLNGSHADLQAQAHRLRFLQPVDAGARRRHAGARRRLRAEAGGRGQHVPAYLACRIDGGVRAGGWRRRRRGGRQGKLVLNT